MIPSRVLFFLNPPFYTSQTFSFVNYPLVFSTPALTELPTPTSVNPTSSIQTLQPSSSKFNSTSSKRERSPSLAPPIAPKTRKIPKLSDRKSLPALILSLEH